MLFLLALPQLKCEESGHGGRIYAFLFSTHLATWSLDLENAGSWRELAWRGVTFQQRQGICWPGWVSPLCLEGQSRDPRVILLRPQAAGEGRPCLGTGC